MPENSPDPHVNLSRLRDIGWGIWDPLGLLPTMGDPTKPWHDDANRDFADEYDSYLVFAASELRRGKSPGHVTEYLVQIEAQHMALPDNPTMQTRAHAVIDALLDDPEIWLSPEPPDEPRPGRAEERS